MTREQALMALQEWDPETGDLSDELARWIAEDEELAAAFDARFEPIEDDDDTLVVPEGLQQRLVAGAMEPRRPRWVPWAIGIAASAAFAAIGVGTLTVGTFYAPGMEPMSVASQGQPSVGGDALPWTETERAHRPTNGVADPTREEPPPVDMGRYYAVAEKDEKAADDPGDAVVDAHFDTKPDIVLGMKAKPAEQAPDGYMGMADDLFDDAPAPRRPTPTAQMPSGPSPAELKARVRADQEARRRSEVVTRPGVVVELARNEESVRGQTRTGSELLARLSTPDSGAATTDDPTATSIPPAEHRVVVSSARIEIRDQVRFLEASAEPSPESAPLLDAVADVLRQRPDLEIEVSGHADRLEAEAGILATARAHAVRKELIDRGVSPEQLVPVGYADGRPIAQTPGSSHNRRAEFRILTHEEPHVPEPVRGEGYTDYGHHAFVHTNEDPLSTFSIDVDTASYSVTRRKLTDGFLPPTAAVRVEEFVNAMPYDYPAPQGDPFAVAFEGAPSPFNPRTHYVRVGVQGKKIAASARKPANLVFLVDTSGSMSSPDKLGLVQQSLRMLTEELRDGDTVAIVAYAGSAGVVLEPTPVSQKDAILAAIDRLQSGGSTAMGQGIELAYALADRGRANGAISRVIVASDGDANVGPVHHSELSKLIRRHALNGVTLTTLGFGTGNYQDTTMEQLANDGDGNYFYIDTRDEARKVLVDRLTSTIQVIARDVKIQVEWSDDAVVAYRLVGYENRDIADRDFRNDKVDAGEIGAGHQVTALYEVALRPGASGELATLRLRAKAPGPDAPATERSWTMPVEAIRGDLAESSADFKIALGAASFAEVLRGSPHVHGASFRAIGRIVESALRPEYDEDRELLGLIYRADQLSR